MKKLCIIFVFGLLFFPISSFAEENQIMEVSGTYSSFDENISQERTDITDLKRHLSEIEQKIEELRQEREQVLNKLKTVQREGREVQKEKKEASKIKKEEWIEETNIQEKFSKELSEYREEPNMTPFVSEKESLFETQIIPSETKSKIQSSQKANATPVFRFSPWKKDQTKLLAPLKEFKISPQMLQQSVILSPDQKLARKKQAEAKKKLMRYNKINR